MPRRDTSKSYGAIWEKSKAPALAGGQLSDALELFGNAHVMRTQKRKLFALNDCAACSAYVPSNRLKLRIDSRLLGVLRDVHRVGESAPTW